MQSLATFCVASPTLTTSPAAGPQCPTIRRGSQRLVVEYGLDSPLLVSLRSVAMGHASERMRFTVHTQPLLVTRLKIGERKRVTLLPPTEIIGGDNEDQLLPAMYFYHVRVPALHELLLHVEASQPVLLAASLEGLVALVSSSPRLLAEGFPGNPAELLMRSTEKDHTVHVCVTLLSPPEGFEIVATLQEAPVPPPVSRLSSPI